MSITAQTKSQAERVRLASANNPIIGATVRETLQQAACAASVLSRYHSDIADWQFVADTSDVCGPDMLLNNEQRGLSLLCACVSAALWFEVEGRE